MTEIKKVDMPENIFVLPPNNIYSNKWNIIIYIKHKKVLQIEKNCNIILAYKYDIPMYTWEIYFVNFY